MSAQNWLPNGTAEIPRLRKKVHFQLCWGKENFMERQDCGQGLRPGWVGFSSDLWRCFITEAAKQQDASLAWGPPDRLASAIRGKHRSEQHANLNRLLRRKTDLSESRKESTCAYPEKMKKRKIEKRKSLRGREKVKRLNQQMHTQHMPFIRWRCGEAGVKHKRNLGTSEYI